VIHRHVGARAIAIKAVLDALLHFGAGLHTVLAGGSGLGGVPTACFPHRSCRAVAENRRRNLGAGHWSKLHAAVKCSC
jgi:hypothetical protein